MDFDNIKSQLKQEVQSAFNICAELLIEFHGDNLSYIYSKGSANKPWESLIDYVPLVGDIDLHYGVYDDKKLFNMDNPRKASLGVTLEYENRFNQENPDKIHIPRTQIMCVNIFENTAVQFVHSLSTSVKMLFGEFPQYPEISDADVKEIDLNNLALLKPYLDILPDSWLDKVGMDYWSSLRQLNWKVSPSPVRILTQLLPDPMIIWTWNRTKVKQELENLQLNDIANMYENFYLNGWELFKSNISSTEYYQKCLLSGSDLVELCYNWYSEHSKNDITD